MLGTCLPAAATAAVIVANAAAHLRVAFNL
jgi:hypothetical protein